MKLKQINFFFRNLITYINNCIMFENQQSKKADYVDSMN